ncbi:hypothetical protein BMJ20_31525 [Sinorhizobium medicae]|nr:hypothetical protein BMJ20_31525 [Sinorhizobium medicae]
MPVITRNITIVSGQNLKRGAVLGNITTSDKYTLSASAAADGSQTPALVLATDCDASAGDVVAAAYASGAFDSTKLILGAGHTASLPRLTRAAPSIRRNSFWAPDTRPRPSRPLSARQALPSTCAS